MLHRGGPKLEMLPKRKLGNQVKTGEEVRYLFVSILLGRIYIILQELNPLVLNVS